MSTMPPIQIPIGANAKSAIASARSAIESNGGQVTGDDTAGDFSIGSPIGAVKGNYALSGPTLTVTITEKPMFAPASMIEAKIKEFFGNKA